jgi:hypothetical protein
MVDTEVHARLGSRTGSELTAEGAELRVLIKRFSGLYELCVSAVNTLSQ